MVWGDVKSSAALLLQLHGLSALEVALKRVDDCTLFGDSEGEVLWAKILAELTVDCEWELFSSHSYTVH